MHWTTEQPTQPGWYWFRLEPHCVVIARVHEGHEGTLLVGWLTDEFRTCGLDTMSVSGEWSSEPIKEPEAS